MNKRKNMSLLQPAFVLLGTHTHCSENMHLPVSLKWWQPHLFNEKDSAKLIRGKMLRREKSNRCVTRQSVRVCVSVCEFVCMYSMRVCTFVCVCMCMWQILVLSFFSEVCFQHSIFLVLSQPLRKNKKIHQKTSKLFSYRPGAFLKYRIQRKINLS